MNSNIPNPSQNPVQTPVPTVPYGSGPQGGGTPSSKNRTIFWVIGGILVLVLVIIVVVLVFKKDNRKEEPSSTSNTNTNTNTSENTNTNSNIPVTGEVISYNGIQFTKLEGYQYEVLDDGLLEITSDDISLEVLEENEGFRYEYYVQNPELLRVSLDSNVEIGEITKETFQGREMLITNLKYDLGYLNYAILKTNKTGYVIQASVMNNSFTVDKNLYNVLAEIVNHSN